MERFTEVELRDWAADGDGWAAEVYQAIMEKREMARNRIAWIAMVGVALGCSVASMILHFVK